MPAATGLPALLKSMLVILLPLQQLSPNNLIYDFDTLSGTTAAAPLRQRNALAMRFECFRSAGTAIHYTITLCGDIPDNLHPERVSIKKEPGHVFLILAKQDSGRAPVCQVFGFYPRRPASSLIFKNVHCVILDNGEREYNVSVCRELTATEFEAAMDAALRLSAKRYNINKYNCYDYALGVFNSLPGIEPIPVSHVKFPFIFGSGGSPCALYRDLKRLSDSGSTWAPYIRFGIFRSPASSSR